MLLLAALLAAGPATAAVAAIPLASATPARTVGFDGLVYASVQVGTTVYVGGSFRNAIVGGRQVPRKRLAAVDVRTGDLLPWAPPADGTVFALAASGSSLYATGKFATVAGQPRPGLAGIHLATGAVGPIRHTIAGTGKALAAGGGRLYLGGEFTAVDAKPARNLAAFRLSDATLDTGFRGEADGKVQSLTSAGSRLYVGGGFKHLNDTATARLGALRLSDGQVDSGFHPATPYPALAVTVTADRVYAGLSGVGGRVVAYRPDGAMLWSSVTDGDIQAIAYLNGAVYAGGHFTVACPQRSRTATSWCPATLRKQPKLAAWDAATGALLDWNPRSNGKWGVLTMNANPRLGVITVGGEFTSFGSHDRPRFAQFRTCRYGCGSRPPERAP
ncbi:hypothetical protein FHX34_103714 [Actinoplanes teichomyceticus]|uniref:Pyrroloquinoline-quinone binding quinoprotein n=1 Tax=Actinoplanes teichomyceticus TaxID=1867 RepID=A0A561WBE1_ACTTI|nr:hypothetical protein FHX34_103714 [Actinoplanes teichomyceticus]GIF15005.1 hypothetical protein Ate01nite_50370 [Actinoplanes teichomyceticus]